MQRAVYTQLGSQSSFKYGVDSYDSTKLGLGPLMCQQNNAGNEGKFAGPLPVGILRPQEFTTAMSTRYPWAMQWSNSTASQVDWIFFADGAAAGATRKIGYATYNRLTQSYNFAGILIVTLPVGTNITVTGFRMTYDKHIAGTVAVSGTAVTGTSTTWQTDRACVGNRIGFGSTDPSQITTWYEISAIANDTGITLTTTAGTVTAGTAYVIEDLRAVILTTNATGTNGGLFVVKGLRPEIFNATGTGTAAIGAATTVDNIRASYWLADASTVTNVAGCGLAIEPVTSKTAHVCWALDSTTNIILYKYNLRGALTLTAGKDFTTLTLKSGAGGALSGTISTANNGRFASLSHGPGSGIGCIYFCTTTKIYRTTQTSTISAASTSFIADNMSEVPPGGVNTFAASSLMNSIEYISSIDKFVIAVNSTTSPFRCYVTGYNTGGSQFDRVFGGDTRQIDQGTADASITPYFSYTGGAPSVWESGGLLYVSTIGTTTITNRIYVFPLGADWEYAASTGNRLFLPAMTITNADKFVAAFATEIQVVGGATGKNLGQNVDPWRMYYRTSGITDDSGAWTLLDQTNTLSGVTGASSIQLMIEFRTISLICLAARINSVGVIYNDLTTDAHYQFSGGKTDLTAKKFAWRFATAFGSSVPALRVRLTNSVTAGSLVDDNTASPTGTFEKSTDGGSSWVAWTNADKGNETTYVRYTPTSLADNINVTATLTLN